MAIGDNNMEGLYGIGFSDIYGSPKGGDSLKDIINTLYEVVREQGGFGTKAAEDDYSLSHWGDYGKGLQGEGHEGPYNLPNVLKDLKEKTQQGGMYYDVSGTPEEEDEASGMQKLYSLLSSEGINIPSLLRGYATDIGDVKTEISGQLQQLQSSLTGKGKGSRYGNIGSGGKMMPGKGTRGAYESDYYDLMSQQSQLTQDLQTGVTEDFRTGISDWMSLNV